MNDHDLSKKDVVITDTANDTQTVIPLLAEEMEITKKKVDTGRVQVTTVTREREQLVDELLAREQVEVERIAVGKPIEALPPIREEGDTIIVPVVEEVLVVERRLVLKEEVHVRRVHRTERYQRKVKLRKQEAVVTRLPVETSTSEAISVSKDRSEGHIEENK